MLCLTSLFYGLPGNIIIFIKTRHLRNTYKNNDMHDVTATTNLPQTDYTDSRVLHLTHTDTPSRVHERCHVSPTRARTSLHAHAIRVRTHSYVYT